MAAIGVFFIGFIGLMIWAGITTTREDAVRKERRDANIKNNSSLLCQNHGGVLFVTTQKTWQEINYIVYCGDNQHYEHIQNFIFTESK